jgi:L-aspartate oxidase
MTASHDVIVIGSGAAGLSAALALAETRRVLVLAKGSLTGGSTAWAQGGIAAVLDAGDTFENHIRDTMVAGAGLNRLATVEFVIAHAPAAIERLSELGVPFNMDRDTLHLTREGGHSHRRIVHVDDATGWAVQAALLKAAEANPNVTMLPGRACIDLITGRNAEKYSGSGRVWGVYALDEATGTVEAHVARATILATGGAGRVYQATGSRWPGAPERASPTWR